MKKFLAIVLAVVMLLPVFAVNSFAADATTELRLNVGGREKALNVPTDKNGEYEISMTENITGYDWAVFKCGAGNDETASNFEKGTVVELIEFKLNGEAVELKDSFSKKVTVGDDKKVVFSFYNKYTGSDNFDNKPASVTSASVKFKVTVPAADKPSSGTDTATGSFVCTFADNDYDSNVKTMTGVAADGTWGGCFPIITEIIEKVAPLSQVKSVEVTVKASNTDPCAKGATPKVELHWNTRSGPNAMTANFVDGVAVVKGELPEGTTNVVLNPYAFASEAGEITFDISVAVTHEAPSTEAPIFSIGQKVIKDPWADGFIITSNRIAEFVEACSQEDAKFVMTYTITETLPWCNFNLNGNSNTNVDGSVSGDPAKTNLGAPVSGLDLTAGENKVFEMSGAQLLAFFTAQEGKVCTGLWSPNGNTNVGDIYKGFDDVNNIESLQIQPGVGDGKLIIESIEVIAAVKPVVSDAKNGPCVYVNEEYHAQFIGGKFLASAHIDYGTGFCPMCNAEIAQDLGDVEPTDILLYSMDKTGGQDSEGAALADGVLAVDNENNGRFRYATNWVGGGAVWKDVINALNASNAYVKVTYTGNVTGLVFQSENGGFESEIAPEVVVDGDKMEAWFNCADVVAGSPVVMSGDFGGWANAMIMFDGETTVYGFDVIIPANAPGETSDIEVIAPTESTGSETDDPDTDISVEDPTPETPVENNPPMGLSLVVLPMVIAAAAVVASKRR